jgi:hypothetical protein
MAEPSELELDQAAVTFLSHAPCPRPESFFFRQFLLSHEPAEMPSRKGCKPCLPDLGLGQKEGDK